MEMPDLMPALLPRDGGLQARNNLGYIFGVDNHGGNDQPDAPLSASVLIFLTPSSPASSMWAMYPIGGFKGRQPSPQRKGISDQGKDFIDAARTLDCDESEERFDAALIDNVGDQRSGGLGARLNR
jgi:hypothetical protein